MGHKPTQYEYSGMVWSLINAVQEGDWRRLTLQRGDETLTIWREVPHP